MATSNFYCKNTSHLFVVSDDDNEEFDVNEHLDSVREEMRAKAETAGYTWSKHDYHPESEDRASFIGTITKHFVFDSQNMEVSIDLLLRAGYYSGYCFDWEAFGCWNGSDEVMDSDWGGVAPDLLACISGHSVGLSTILAVKLEKRMEAYKDELVAFTEGLFSRAADSELRQVGRFSNGECIYEQYVK